jgi:spermidine/putrescine transport system substrate-binding protein
MPASPDLPDLAAFGGRSTASGRSRGPGPSRRAVLTGLGAAGVAGLSGCGLGLPGLGSGAAGTGSPGSASPAAGTDVSATDKVVAWSSWVDYLDLEPMTNSYPTLRQFEHETGITPAYSVDIDDNETYYRTVVARLRQGRDIGRDLIVVTDWMVARLIRQGYVQRLDHANIPNLVNLRADLRDVAFDKGRNYSLTWQSGFTGIGFNVKRLRDEGITLTSVSDLWQDKLHNRVVVLSEMRDTIGLIMLDQGKDPATFTAGDFAAALQVLRNQLERGQIRQVAGNGYLDLLTGGDAVAALAWSGDIAGLGPDYRFVLPDRGGLAWSDDLVVPIGATHKQNAEILMNYYYDPAVMAKVGAVDSYVGPVEGTREAIAKIDPTLATNPLIFPLSDPASPRKVHTVRALDPAEEAKFTASFDAVLGV